MDMQGQSTTADAPAGNQQRPCGNCGATLTFDMQEQGLTCPYCGHETAIAPQPGSSVVGEQDLQQMLDQFVASAETIETANAACDACGAVVEPPEHAHAFACPFCGSDIVADVETHNTIKPAAVLPFKVEQTAALEAFRSWLNSLWYAPNKLKQTARVDDALVGMYVPYWTFDAHATARYRGKCKGKNSDSWHNRSGEVWETFDDLLVVATDSLPAEKTENLEPWDLENLVPYSDEYLRGFRAERYSVNIQEGFKRAQARMDEALRKIIKKDMGGSSQRIERVDTRLDDLKFKHILLPIWIAAYRFEDQVYRFVINGRTGEVQGERPWSKWKIALTTAAVLAGIATLVYFQYSGAPQ